MILYLLACLADGADTAADACDRDPPLDYLSFGKGMMQTHCAGCHSDTVKEWASSSMAHAQTSTINVAQLPLTIAENRELAEEVGGIQEERFEAAAKSCNNCHAQVGARFYDEIESATVR